MNWMEVNSAEQGPVVIWGTSQFSADSLDHMRELLVKEGLADKLTVVAFVVSDWDAAFSPWAAPAFEDQRAFAGQGPETLTWLTNELVPELRKRHGLERPLWLMGYSLAGLFALWSAYETSLFDGIICCSGSLWFEGWSIYVETHALKRPCSIYLSLGGKESETSNPVLKTVADCIRVQAQRLKADPQVKKCVLEWNKGGHFADSEKRLVKGLGWMWESYKK